ncbi:hypothetical protein HI914_03844 [Erysiphe necator]|uniref:Uncharacterized protein n=1 Tax=Uncinula necator TaxID=52586 RepID=A0A0B1P6P5_UNCNE|nr:hypothetical protein HI914_03844 [Erysiphe necator]KHJ32616.1 hypothetical protein EV44_g4652 [Erysiphe necator]
MASIFRVLVKTDHMISRKKIDLVKKASQDFPCAVLLKVGGKPGMMFAEGEGAEKWLNVVKKLRYKGFRLQKKELVSSALLDLQPGKVIEFESVRDLAAFLSKRLELYEWWRTHMGYK